MINIEIIRNNLIVLTKSYFNDWKAKCRVDHVNKFCDLLQLWEKSHNSTLHMLRRVDMLRLHYVRYLGGNPLLETDKIRLKAGGLPACLHFLPLHSKEAQDVRFILTLLTSTRAITLKGIPDVSVITQSAESSVNPKLLSFVDVWVQKLKQDGIRVPRSKDDFFKEYHPSTKVGPNGHAFASLFGDLEVVSYDPLMLENIKALGGKILESFIDVLVQSGLIRYLTDISLKYSMVKPTIPKTGRLSCISDKNGKLRIIAIFDYWSQTALKGLHDYLYEVLACIPEDCTFSQGEKVISHLSKDGPYYCFDLKSATDRFPVSFQEIVLAKIIGEKRAAAWKSLLVDRDFSTPEFWKVPGNTVKYAVGQPLGAYSSWAAFTLSHHVLIRHCFDELGIPCTGKYLVLGDDVVIAHRGAARLYTKRLTELGVEISKTKSLISRDTLEFAKRYWHKGIEVSPISTSGFISTQKRVHLLVPFLVALRSRGYGLMYEIPCMVGQIYRNLKTSRVERLVVKARAFLTVSNILNGRIGEVEGLNTLAPIVKVQSMPCGSSLQIVANTIFSMAVTRLRNVSTKTVSYITDIGGLAMDPPSHILDGSRICENNLVIPMSSVLESARSRLIPWLELFKEAQDRGGIVDLSSLPLDYLIIPTIDKIVREESSDDIRNALTMALTNRVLSTWKSVFHREDFLLLAPSPDESLII
jgi:hypothetical protein